jgi:hypothetical protein
LGQHPLEHQVAGFARIHLNIGKSSSHSHGLASRDADSLLAPMRMCREKDMRIQHSGKKTLAPVLLALAAGTIASPAFADHAFNTDTPYVSRGACEAADADFDNGDREWLSEAAGLSDGAIRSMLQRAWQCELGSDGQWYITDHRFEVLSSDWWLRRLPE